MLFKSVAVYTTVVSPTGNEVPEGKVLTKLFKAQSVATGSVQVTVAKHCAKDVGVRSMLAGHPVITGGSVSPELAVQQSSPPVRLLALRSPKLPYMALGSNINVQFASMLTLKTPLIDNVALLPLNFPFGAEPTMVNWSPGLRV